MRYRLVFSRYAGFRTGLWGLLLYALLALVSQNKAWPDVVAETLAPPSFSHDSGFYDQPFDLVLTHPYPGVQIFYTLDGSIPDPDKLDGIHIRDRTGELVLLTNVSITFDHKPDYFLGVIETVFSRLPSPAVIFRICPCSWKPCLQRGIASATGKQRD